MQKYHTFHACLQKDPFWNLTSCDFFLGISLGVTQGKLCRLAQVAQPPHINPPHHKIPPHSFLLLLFQSSLTLVLSSLTCFNSLPWKKTNSLSPSFFPFPSLLLLSICVFALYWFKPLKVHFPTLKADWHFEGKLALWRQTGTLPLPFLFPLVQTQTPFKGCSQSQSWPQN